MGQGLSAFYFSRNESDTLLESRHGQYILYGIIVRMLMGMSKYGIWRTAGRWYLRQRREHVGVLRPQKLSWVLLICHRRQEFVLDMARF